MPRHIYIYTNTGFHRTKEADRKKTKFRFERKVNDGRRLALPYTYFLWKRVGLTVGRIQYQQTVPGETVAIKTACSNFKKAITYSAGY